MKNLFSNLLGAALVATLPLATAHAQTKTTTKTTTTTPRPAAKPAAKPVAKPATTTTKTTITTTRPAPAPAPAPTPPPSRPAPATKAKAMASTGGPFEEGTNVINLGIGLGYRYSYGAGLFGGSSSTTPAFSISYERGILPLGPGVLGVGIFGGYQSASIDFGSGYRWKYTDIVVTLRGAFHYPVTDQFDAYGGLNLGLRHLGSSVEGNGNSYIKPDSYNELAGGLFVGGRYYFTDAIGAFAELGYDQTFLKVGLSAKF